jgi:hypothetical protein
MKDRNMAIGRPILMGSLHCTPQGHNNQQAGGQGRAGTAGGGRGNVSYDVFFLKDCNGVRMINHGHFMTRRPILMSPLRCTPQGHSNQPAGGWGRAGTAGGRRGKLVYKMLFLN